MVAEAMLEVPAGGGDSAQQAASRLRGCARGVRGATARWDSLAAPAWFGQAAGGFDQARALLSRRLRDLDEVADRFGDAVQAYAQEMAVVLPAWRAAVDDWHRARGRELDSTDPLLAQQDTFDAELAVVRWHARHEAAGRDLADAAARVLAGLQPYNGAEHQVEDGVRTFVQVGLVEPVRSVAFLAFGWAVDSPRWRQQVTSMPAAAGNAARHPWDTFRATARSASGADHFAAGRWGAGAGTLAAGLVGGKGLGKGLKRQPVHADVRDRFPGAVFPDHLPEPRTQTLDEMLTDGVDLSRQEYGDLGHTLRRHVDVDDAYLADRLDNGTIEQGWVRGGIPRTASAWNDLQTAEASITFALKTSEGRVRAWATERGVVGERLTLTLTSSDGSVVGRSMWDSDGDRLLKDTPTFVVTLVRTNNGGFAVLTSYPERPTS